MGAPARQDDVAFGRSTVLLKGGGGSKRQWLLGRQDHGRQRCWQMSCDTSFFLSVELGVLNRTREMHWLVRHMR